ncbi:hypothetical protein ES702_03279 [subsurface metagenome]
MVLPEEGKTLICEYCGKETVATQNMDHYWLCLSEVKGGEESLEAYLCSRECLKAYVNKPFVFSLERLTQDSKKAEWQIEELLIHSNLLDKVNRHKPVLTCALCKKDFVSGDLCVFFKDKVMHEKCIEGLKKT